MKELLEQEEKTSVCEACDLCICKELEALKILFEIRQGTDRNKILKKVEKSLKKQPMDEYLLAIKKFYGK